MTPKSLLRLPQAASRIEDLALSRWQPILDDPAAAGHAGEITRVVLCTGKIYYELLAEAEKLKADRPALVRLEQLYSFPWPEARAVLARYPRMEELIWVQEEPRNMGAWSYLAPKLEELAPAGVQVRYVGRPERASPAEGYPAAHSAEQSRIIREALATPTAVAAGGGKA